MNETYAAILAMIQSALTARPCAVAEGVDWDRAFAICKRHYIVPIVYYGMLCSGITGAPLSLFASMSMRMIVQEQHQLDMLETLERRFAEEGIDYLPIKGSVLKSLYPKTEMRMMSDMDILIRAEQQDKVDALLTGMGCDRRKDSDHVVVYLKKPFIVLEIHTALVPSYDRDYYAVFKDGWDRAEPIAPGAHRYRTSVEDTFLFVVAHLAKHYREGGIGLRQFVDVRLLQKRYPDMDMRAVRRGLQALGIERFYDNVCATLGVWFDGDPATELTDFLTVRTFEGGAYGSDEKHRTAVAVRTSEDHGGVKKGRAISLWQAVFMPLREMKTRYPILRKAPILLPIMWVVRWVTAVFQPKRIRARAERIGRINHAEIDAYTAELQYVGLSFETGPAPHR